MRNDLIHHLHALRACWPMLKRGPQSILDIGPDPIPWLRTIEHFAGTHHRLAGCVQNAEEDIAPESEESMDHRRDRGGSQREEGFAVSILTPRSSASSAVDNLGEDHYPLTPIELDVWSPLARKGLPAELPAGDYTLITALAVVDHLYHPEPFFRAASTPGASWRMWRAS
jgi:hypothetical protein